MLRTTDRNYVRITVMRTFYVFVITVLFCRQVKCLFALSKSLNNKLKFVNSGKPFTRYIIIPVVKTPIIGNNNFAS